MARGERKSRQNCGVTMQVVTPKRARRRVRRRSDTLIILVIAITVIPTLIITHTDI